MISNHCILIGAPIDCGKRRRGCLMGPDAYRTADIAQKITELGYEVEDRGNVNPGTFPADEEGGNLHALNETIAWTRALTVAAKAAIGEGLPIFMGGDHALSLATVAGVAEYASDVGRPLFVLQGTTCHWRGVSCLDCRALIGLQF